MRRALFSEAFTIRFTNGLPPSCHTQHRLYCYPETSVNLRSEDFYLSTRVSFLKLELGDPARRLAGVLAVVTY